MIFSYTNDKKIYILSVELSVKLYFFFKHILRVLILRIGSRNFEEFDLYINKSDTYIIRGVEMMKYISRRDIREKINCFI